MSVDKYREGSAFSKSGFTLVELLAVLVVLSIIAFVAIGRIVDSSPFDRVVAIDSILSMARNCQQKSFSGSSVSLQVSSEASEVVFSSVLDGSVLDTRRFGLNELLVTANSSPISAPSNCSSITSTITIGFDGAGEIVGAYAEGVQICLDSLPSICISSSGFAYQGSCS